MIKIARRDQSINFFPSSAFFASPSLIDQMNLTRPAKNAMIARDMRSTPTTATTLPLKFSMNLPSSFTCMEEKPAAEAREKERRRRERRSFIKRLISCCSLSRIFWRSNGLNFTIPITWRIATNSLYSIFSTIFSIIFLCRTIIISCI